MAELTPYQQEKFPHLESSIKDGQWYNIKADRPDRKEFIECLKLYIDYWGNLELNEDYTKFRRCYPLKTLMWLQENNKLALMQEINEMHDKLRDGLNWKDNRK